MLKRDRKLEREVKKMFERCRKEPQICKVTKPTICYGVAHLEKEHFTEPQSIVCKWCGSTDIMKYGIRKGVQNYICKACGRVFIAKDAPYHMQTSTDQIGAALNMFYDGMSVSAIANHLKETCNNPVNASTVYRWLIRIREHRLWQPELVTISGRSMK